MSEILKAAEILQETYPSYENFQLECLYKHGRLVLLLRDLLLAGISLPFSFDSLISAVDCAKKNSETFEENIQHPWKHPILQPLRQLQSACGSIKPLLVSPPTLPHPPPSLCPSILLSSESTPITDILYLPVTSTASAEGNTFAVPPLDHCFVGPPLRVVWNLLLASLTLPLHSTQLSLSHSLIISLLPSFE